MCCLALPTSNVRTVHIAFGHEVTPNQRTSDAVSKPGIHWETMTRCAQIDLITLLDDRELFIYQDPAGT